MSGAAATNVSMLDPDSTELQILREHSHNLLLEGPAAATDAVLHQLQPHIREPIAWGRPHARFELPKGEANTLILRDAAALNDDDQRRLLEWLGGQGSRTQIISTTERPLFTLVTGGLFDAALYYRLNVMLLRVGARNPHGSSRDDADGAYRRHDNPMAISTLRLA